MSMDLANAEEQLSAAYDTYADPIFRHCYFRIHDREQAKDLMQQVFLKLWEYLESGREVENIQALLYRIANNLVIDYTRQNKRRITESLEQLHEDGQQFASGENTKEAVQNHFTELHVHSLLDQMKEPYRTAVMMRYIDELHPPEIASALKISVSNASARISRGLSMLRSLLENE